MDSDEARYQVLVNLEEQYSLWPADAAIPPGWRACGVIGPKSTCLKYVSSVWTDMRPERARGARFQ